MGRARSVVFGATTTLVLASADAAAAHGVGGRSDLPLPAWQVAWAAAVAVVVSFAVLNLVWLTPRLRAEPGERASLGTALAVNAICVAVTVLVAELVTADGDVLSSRLLVLVAVVVAGAAFGRAGLAIRLLSLALFGLVIAAGLFGEDSGQNIGPITVYAVLWVGLPIASLLFGDVWRTLSPWDTLARGLERIVPRVRGAGSSPQPASGFWDSRWPAVVAMVSFLWFEVGYVDGGSPRAIGVWGLVYTVYLLVGVVWRGRRFLDNAECFGVLFSLIAAMSPFDRREDGLRFRRPLSGLASMHAPPGTVPFILVVLGGTTFDGFSGTDTWRDWAGDRFGWPLTWFNTWGIAAAIIVVAAAYWLASAIGARIIGGSAAAFATTYGPSLVPIVLAYAVGHYFSLLVLDGQGFFTRLSDPFVADANWFGTVTWAIDFTLVSPTTIAWVQAASIAVGHVLGVIVAHDRAVGDHSGTVAFRSQLPMVGVMVAYTVVGLLLLAS